MQGSVHPRAGKTPWACTGVLGPQQPLEYPGRSRRTLRRTPPRQSMAAYSAAARFVSDRTYDHQASMADTRFVGGSVCSGSTTVLQPSRDDLTSGGLDVETRVDHRLTKDPAGLLAGSLCSANPILGSRSVAPPPHKKKHAHRQQRDRGYRYCPSQRKDRPVADAGQLGPQRGLLPLFFEAADFEGVRCH